MIANHHLCLRVTEGTAHAVPQAPLLPTPAVPGPHGRARSLTGTLTLSSQPGCRASRCGSPAEERRTGRCIRRRPSSALPSFPTRPRKCLRGQECPSGGPTPSLLVRAAVLWGKGGCDTCVSIGNFHRHVHFLGPSTQNIRSCSPTLQATPRRSPAKGNRTSERRRQLPIRKEPPHQRSSRRIGSIGCSAALCGYGTSV